MSSSMSECMRMSHGSRDFFTSLHSTIEFCLCSCSGAEDGDFSPFEMLVEVKASPPLRFLVGLDKGRRSGSSKSVKTQIQTSKKVSTLTWKL
jgi:hypothetical protein